MRIQDIIVKPVITEKALTDSAANVYVLEVSKDASKHQIKVAVEKLFDAEVDTIKTLIRKGKVKRVGKRMLDKERPSVKRAYVTLKKGKIDIIAKS